MTTQTPRNLTTTIKDDQSTFLISNFIGMRTKPILIQQPLKWNFFFHFYYLLKWNLKCLFLLLIALKVGKAVEKQLGNHLKE